MSKYGDFPGPYFPTFGLTVGKYGPEKSPYLDTFHRVGEVLIRASGGGGGGWGLEKTFKINKWEDVYYLFNSNIRNKILRRSVTVMVMLVSS